MFCRHCGKEIVAESAFCSGCGGSLSNTKQENKSNQNQKNIGEHIISGDGTYMRKHIYLRILQSVISLGIAIFFLARIENMRDTLPRRQVQQHDMLTIIMVIIVTIIFIEVAWMLFRMWQIYIAQFTTVSVHENILKGKFATGFMNCSMKEINLYYNTIGNVDTVKNNGITIHTQGVKYTCYSKNSEEIRDKIMEIAHE